MEVRHRRFLAVDHAAPGLEMIAAAADEQRRQVFVQVAVAIREAGAVDDHRVVEEAAIAFLDRLEVTEPSGQLLGVCSLIWMTLSIRSCLPW